jgi:hypothetical protein
LCEQDLQQEVFVPAAESSFRHEALFARMLFEQRQCESPEPRQIFGKMLALTETINPLGFQQSKTTSTTSVCRH